MAYIHRKITPSLSFPNHLQFKKCILCIPDKDAAADGSAQPIFHVGFQEVSARRLFSQKNRSQACFQRLPSEQLLAQCHRQKSATRETNSLVLFLFLKMKTWAVCTKEAARFLPLGPVQQRSSLCTVEANLEPSRGSFCCYDFREALTGYLRRSKTNQTSKYEFM